jgi:hypothetical protein
MVNNRSSVATQTEDKILPAQGQGYTAEILRGVLLELYTFTSQMEDALEHLEQQHLKQHPEQQGLEQHYQDGQQPYAVAQTDQHQVKPVQSPPHPNVVQAVTQPDVTVLSPARPDTSVANPVIQSPKQSPDDFQPRISAKQNIHQHTPDYIFVPVEAMKTSQPQLLPSIAQPRHQATNLARPAYILSSDHRPSNMQSQAEILQSQDTQK